MAIGACPWCDFISYTPKALSVERVCDDRNFWEQDLLPLLEEFYKKCVAPETISPVRVLGLPVVTCIKKS